MIPTWERPGSPVFQRVFVGSLAFATSVLLVVLLASALPLGRAPAIVSYAVLGGAFSLLWPAFTRWIERRPTFLKSPAGMTAAEGLVSVLGWAIVLYVAFGLVFGGIALAVVSREDHHWPMVVMGLAAYLPLLFIGPPAAVIAWKRTQRAAQQ